MKRYSSQALIKGLHFVVPGKPATSGSKTGYAYTRRDGSTGVAMTESCGRAKSHRAVVRAVAMDAYSGKPSERAIKMHTVFYTKRPKSHYRTGRFSGMLKDSALRYPITRPDATKEFRHLEDSLTGVIYKDDSQVVFQVVSKEYAEEYSTHVSIWEIE